MRKLVLALTFSVLAVGTAHCVGDEPPTINTNPQDDIAEIIGYSAALSDDERGQIEAYLKQQWGFTF